MPSPNLPSPNSSVVVEFLAALRDRDYLQALDFTTDDVVWHNVSLPKVTGRRNLARAVALMDKLALRFDVRFHHVATDGEVVLTERTDALSLGRLRCEFWVCGTFEFHDGRIAVWRDRFDYANVAAGLLRGLVGVVLPQREPFELFEARLPRQAPEPDRRAIQ